MAQLDEDQMWDAENAQEQPTPTRRATNASPARRGSPPCTLGPLTKENAVGRRVLVPCTRYPSHRCDENDGQGWEATIRSATGLSAMVRYTYATTRDGRAYEDTRETFDVLTALD